MVSPEEKYVPQILEGLVAVPKLESHSSKGVTIRMTVTRRDVGTFPLDKASVL